MRKHRKLAVPGALIVISSLLISCSAQTSSSISTIENRANDYVSLAASHEAKRNSNYVELMSIENRVDSFMSDDETVQYFFTSEIPVSMDSNPVVSVQPHEFTAEEAQQIGKAIFGDATFYKYVYGRLPTASEMEANITRWETYLSDGIVNDLVGGNDLLINDVEQVLLRYKEKYAEAMITAPSIFEPSLCDWTFHPDSYYLGEFAEKEPMTIRTIVSKDDVQYRFDIANRTGPDFTVHMISAYLYNESSPNNIDTLVQQYELCKSPEPSEAQLKSIETQVYSILNALNTGEWTIDCCQFDRLNRGMSEAYIITVKATPVFAESAVLRQTQLTNLKSTSDRAQHFYYTDAEFTFAPSGTLLSCTIQSPVDVIQIDEHRETLSEDTLLQKAKDLLARHSVDDYSGYYIADSNKKLSAKVFIENIVGGLARIEIHNGRDYLYVPAICLDGHYEIYDENGALLANSEEDGRSRMMVINAIDGTEISFSTDNIFTRVQ